MSEPKTGLEKLREPFVGEQISKLPKPTYSGAWDNQQKTRCPECKGYHPSNNVIHLDYVGHAALTARLLDADLTWSWEPLALDANGLPAFDQFGGLWIKLTVDGVTRLGYGDSQGKKGPNAVKEAIGDCLVRGTRVLTATGVRPIEDVRIGEMVPTRKGWRPVTDHWMSSAKAPTVAVLLADGRVLVGTPHHRVPTATRGVQRMGELRNGDMMYTWLATDANSGRSRSRGRADDTVESPITLTATAASTSWPQQPRGHTCIRTSTSMHTGRFPTDGMSITSITTRSTTESRTLPLSLLRRTPLSTGENSWGKSSYAMSAGGISPHYESGLGGAHQLVKSGAEGAMESHTSVLTSSRCVNPATAKSVGFPTWHESRGQSSALVPVVAVLDVGCGEVWNLSVGDVHEYVANGMVVHNSLRNAGMRFGAALDLWHKGDLHDSQQQREPEKPPAPSEADIAREELLETCEPLGWTGPKLARRFNDDYGKDIRTADAGTVRGFQAALVAEAESQDQESA